MKQGQGCAGAFDKLRPHGLGTYKRGVSQDVWLWSVVRDDLPQRGSVLSTGLESRAEVV